MIPGKLGLGCLFGTVWDSLVLFRTVCWVHDWDCLGLCGTVCIYTCLELFGTVWVLVGDCFGSLGACLGLFGTACDSLGAYLGTVWGTVWDSLGDCLGQFRDQSTNQPINQFQNHPNTIPKPSKTLPEPSPYPAHPLKLFNYECNFSICVPVCLKKKPYPIVPTPRKMACATLVLRSVVLLSLRLAKWLVRP